MATQTITVEVPEPLYRSMRRIAAVTRQPLDSIIQESLEHVFPPLDDLPEEEIASLSALSLLDDAQLWREARAMLDKNAQTELNSLLERQGTGELPLEAQARLQSLLDGYGHLMVRKAHAWLLLARRGYRVPPQVPEKE